MRKSVFLKPQEEQEVVEAIRTAEKNTSGEIRVHIESTTPSDALQHAAEIFHLLKMDATKLRNGVLIYVALKDKTFVIYGDEGIDKAVPPGFWNSTRDVMLSHFKQGHFKQGLIAGIANAGEQLQRHFPVNQRDANELDDSISKTSE
jgi:uncharacterized membrane protein